VEWDEYISRHYGEVALQHPGPETEADRAGLDVASVMHDTFGHWDEMQEDFAVNHGDMDCEAPVPEVEESDNDASDEEDLRWGDPVAVEEAFSANYVRLNEAARLPLFEGSPVSYLEAVALLINILRNCQATSLLTLEVFAILHKVILPQPNTLPDSEYEASMLIKSLGLSFANVHACVNSCVLFRGPYKDLQLCPQCREMRM
jgi:hypothetical protein